MNSLPPVWSLFRACVQQNGPSLPSLHAQLTEHERRYQALEEGLFALQEDSIGQEYAAHNDMFRSDVWQYSTRTPLLAPSIPCLQTTPPMTPPPAPYNSSTELPFQQPRWCSSSTVANVPQVRGTECPLRKPLNTPHSPPSIPHQLPQTQALATPPLIPSSSPSLLSMRLQPYSISRHYPPPNQSKSLLQARNTEKLPDPIRCNICMISFSRINDLQRHSRTRHSSVPVVNQCRKCGKMFSRPDSLQRHARKY
ncbi:hypothetical protein BCR33DRAFT_172875, partial [Rhizoclosmatium globosum]